MSVPLRFTGYIAGFGTGAGTRFVVGFWLDSPFGRFADVMVEQADGHRTLLAPTDAVASYVRETYRFDEVVVGPVVARRTAAGLMITAPGLDVRIRVGPPTALDRLLRLVPRSLSMSATWLAVLDLVAGRLVPGAHTAGTAGGGRREYYGVRRSFAIDSIDGAFRGVDLGGSADLAPPVRFGFASMPARPQIVALTTTIVG